MCVYVCVRLKEFRKKKDEGRFQFKTYVGIVT